MLALGSISAIVGCAASNGHSAGANATTTSDVDRNTFDASRVYPAEFVGEWYSVFDDEQPAELWVRLIIDAAGGFQITFLDANGQGRGRAGDWHWERGSELVLEPTHPTRAAWKAWIDPDGEVATLIDNEGRAWALDTFLPADEEEFERVQDLRYD